MAVYSAAIIFFSPTGSTHAVLRSVVQGMGVLDRRYVDLTLPTARQDFGGLCQEDVVVLGTPVYDGALPTVYEQSLQRLWAAGQPAVLCATYGGLGCGNALEELHALAQKAKLRPVAAGLFPARHPLWPHSKYALSEQALSAARELGFDARFRLERGSRPLQQDTRPPCLPHRGWPIGTLRAMSPCRLLPVPQFTAACTQCGLCARECPTGAIASSGMHIDPGLCVRCQRCVELCPQGALNAGTGGLTGRVASLLRRNNLPSDTTLL